MKFISLTRLQNFYTKVKALIDGKVSKAGDTMTGNLTIGSAKVQTNGYVVGTWVQSTASNALSSKPPRIVVQDSSGWFYSRTPAQILGDIEAAVATDYSATLTTTWSGSSAPFYQTVNISGIVSSDTPIIDMVPTTSAYATQETEWARIVKAEAVTGGIKFYAKEKTTTALPIKVKVIR